MALLLRRLAARLVRVSRTVFAAATEFGFAALGMAPPAAPDDPSGTPPGPDGRSAVAAPRQPFSHDELLWMAELEDRDSF